METFLLVLLFCVTTASSIDVLSDGGNEMFSYVRDLISDYNKQQQANSDVAIFKFNMNSKSTKTVDCAFDDIRRAIPDVNPVVMPPNKDVQGRRLPETAFIIIVSDAETNVSTVTIRVLNETHFSLDSYNLESRLKFGLMLRILSSTTRQLSSSTSRLPTLPVSLRCRWHF